jgi:hypothetical protein
MRSGGRGGIRTHEALAGLPVFKTGALNHSATLPYPQYQPLGSFVRGAALVVLLPKQVRKDPQGDALRATLRHDAWWPGARNSTIRHGQAHTLQ